MLSYQRGDWLLVAVVLITLAVMIFGDPIGGDPIGTVRCHLG